MRGHSFKFLLSLPALAITSAIVAFSPGSLQSQIPGSPVTAAIVLGVGSPNIDADRSGTSIGIIASGRIYIFDAGAGVERRLAEARPNLAALKVTRFGPIFISHLHRDHTTGLAALIYYHNIGPGSLVGGEELTIYGPYAKGANFGIIDVVNHLRAALTDPGAAPGIESGTEEQINGLPVHAVEMHAGLVYKDPAIAVSAFEVSHKSPNSFGFRVQTADRVIVFSGDTRPSAAVVQACNGCDLLFHEVFGERFGPQGPTGAAQGHTSAEELADVAKRAHPKRLVVYHDVQLNHERGMEILKKSFSGEVTFARDLDVY
jgi:ribonuclease BN (tRNA processing enzyme)